MCEKREQGNIIHKVNKISRVVCGLFIKFACVHKAVAFVKCLNIRTAAHDNGVQQMTVRFGAKADDRLSVQVLLSSAISVSRMPSGGVSRAADFLCPENSAVKNDTAGHLPCLVQRVK